MSGYRLSPPKNNVCEVELENDFRDVKILSQSELVSENPRTATRVTCESIARLHGEIETMTDDRYQRRLFGPRFGALMDQTQALESSKGLKGIELKKVQGLYAKTFNLWR